ncbi:penicillin-binding protein [Streptomyces griseocarneus]|nr:penicillin-binding protein [Streptomyces griseocarneus]
MAEAEPTPSRRRRPARAVRTARSVTAAALALATAGGGAYVAEWGPFAAAGERTDPAAEAQGRAFLADWAAGRTADAGRRTTSPGQAQDVLGNFTAGLRITGPSLTAARTTATSGTAATVAFTAKMPVADLGTWTYESELPLRKQKDGSWKVHWTLSLVHPELSDTQKFRLDRENTAGPEITDRTGTALTRQSYPSLAPVLSGLAKGAGVGPRGAVQRVDRITGEVTGTEVTFGEKPSRPADRPVRTTIDATWQRAAEKALATKAQGRNAALVALRIDNGEVLAVGNTPSGFNRAVSGTYAPGSAWKIVTSSALLLKNAVRPTDVVDCPKYLTVGKEFHNVETSEHPGATFQQDFTESCNTAFIGLRGKLGDGEPGDVARTYFGVGQQWHTGIPSFDGSVPAPRDQTEKAASMIGQGRVLANPLVMASVTATAVSGTFHQPTFTGDAEDGTSTSRLPQNVVTTLRQMMRATVTDGTAKVLADLPGAVGAKTGTAEVAEDAPNNGWIVAHRGNVAVACVVEQGQTGGASAGPVVRELLGAVPGDAT